MKKQLGFYYEQRHCSGCYTCQVACKDKNNLELGQLFRKVQERSGGGYVETDKVIFSNVFAYWFSISCNHCQDPVCVKKCPTGAMQKRLEDGIVFIDEKSCIGCGLCAEACPYHAPQFDTKSMKMRKCDLCKDQLSVGKLPVCVCACPLRLIKVGQLDELQQKYGYTDNIKGLPDSELTKPSLVIAPHRDAIIKNKENHL